MTQNIKIYDGMIRTWKHFDEEQKREVIGQYEVKFSEYRTDASLVRKGTEDFSAERYSQLEYKWVWVGFGQKRNDGGLRLFRAVRIIGYMKNQKEMVMEYLNAKYPDADLIQLR